MGINHIQCARVEIENIIAFIRDFVMDGERVAVPVSGGMDSDIVARLCHKSLGARRIKLFIIQQSDMESSFVNNARILSEDLNLPLAEIHLERANLDLVRALELGENEQIFREAKLLDSAKAKCYVRSSVISAYQDKGFLIAGTTNRSEKELGLFVTFGDNLANFKPIAHLYKSQLKEIASLLGTRHEVIEQAPSSGLWPGQTDIEDISYWIVNGGPILFARNFSDEEINRAEIIKRYLTQEKIDHVLQLYSCGIKRDALYDQSELPNEIISGLINVVEKSKILKNRTILAELSK